MRRVIGFQLSPHLPPVKENSRHSTMKCGGHFMARCIVIYEPASPKNERVAASCSNFSRKAWTSRTTSPKRHMMTLGVKPGFQTHALSWWHLEVHHHKSCLLNQNKHQDHIIFTYSVQTKILERPGDIPWAGISLLWFAPAITLASSYLSSKYPWISLVLIFSKINML